jgi:UDPglucose 6-dehydrogenase
MRVGLIGCGYVGQAVERLFATHGHQVIAWDRATAAPYPREDLRACDFAVVCVSTPPTLGGRADTSAVCEAVARLPTDRVLVKSTIPPGTIEHLADVTGKEICFWPEYVGESTYYNPYFSDSIEAVPFVIVGGEATTRHWFIDRLQQVLGPTKRYFQCSAREAELIKYAENAYFATKIVFVNEFRRICDALDADWHSVREGWLLDPRVEPMHTAAFDQAPGFGGKCLPKDLDALIHASHDAGYVPALLKEVVRSNARLRAVRGDPPESSGTPLETDPQGGGSRIERPIGHTPILKSKPSDFLVEEACIPVEPPEKGEVSAYRRLRVVKRGYSTFEAIELMASALEVSQAVVGYAGLKDEDGITTQMMSVPAEAVAVTPDPVFEHREGDAYIEARLVGCSPSPIRVGGLIGNSFQLVARGLSEQVARSLALEGRRTGFFLNYYDTQRFGLPGHPKVTHHIGEALVQGDYAKAFHWLKVGQPSAAEKMGCPAEDAFAALDQRKIAFYMSAYESYVWNANLAAVVTTRATDRCVIVPRDGIDYVFLADVRDRRELLSTMPTMPQKRYRVHDASVTVEQTVRPTVTQAMVTFSDVRADGLTWRCSCGFYLPAGSYATMLMAQLLP